MLNTQQFIDCWWQERYALGRITTMTAWASDQLKIIADMSVETEVSKEWISSTLHEVQAQLSLLTQLEVKTASDRFQSFQKEVQDCGTVEPIVK